MNFLNFGGTNSGNGRGAVSTFGHGPAVADRPAPPQLDNPTVSPTPTPRPPRPSVDQIVAEVVTQVWARCRRAMPQRGLSSRKLLRIVGVTAILLGGAHWVFPWAAFASHRTAAQSDENRGDETVMPRTCSDP